MQCPGQDNRYWSGDAVFEIICPHCGNMLEFFKDDSQRVCRQCGHRMLNPKIDFGCASYCPYAEQCMAGLPAGLRTDGGELFRERLAAAVRKEFLNNEQLHRLVTRRAEFGERLCREEGGNLAAIVAAALLSRSADPDLPLTQLAAEKELAVAVIRLLAHGPVTSDQEEKSAAIFHDACLLGDLSLNMVDQPPPCRTATGKREAERIGRQA